jgi:hypothetical protein
MEYQKVKPMSSETELLQKYDDYIFYNTTSFTWIKWKICIYFGIPIDRNIRQVIFKVNSDTLKNKL